MGYCKPFRRGVSWRSQDFGANATIYGPHSGNDDAAPIGTPVHAAGDGVIEFAGQFDDTYHDNLLWLLRMGGNIAVLNCGDNAPSFVYGHLDSFTVKAGDRVRKGQVIAYSGNTGTATTGAHLHTEAIPPGYVLNSPLLGRVNPDLYLTEWPEDINTGSLSYASETITALEDSLSASEVKELRETMQAIADNLFNRLSTEPAPIIAKTVLEYQVPHKDPLTGQDTGNTTSLATMAGYADFQAVQTRSLIQQGPAGVAAQLNAAGLAEAVRDELVKLLGGK